MVPGERFLMPLMHWVPLVIGQFGRDIRTYAVRRHAHINAALINQTRGGISCGAHVCLSLRVCRSNSEAVRQVFVLA